MSNTPIDVWAQDLLVGTNNGPWGCGPDETAYSVWTKHRHTPIATDVDPGDAQLIAAAPELAATVAGLTEEWGVTTEFEGGGAAHTTWRFGSREAAEHYAEAGIVNRSIVPTAIVRRLVGPVEVVPTRPRQQLGAVDDPRRATIAQARR